MIDLNHLRKNGSQVFRRSFKASSVISHKLEQLHKLKQLHSDKNPVLASQVFAEPKMLDLSWYSNLVNCRLELEELSKLKLFVPNSKPPY